MSDLNILGLECVQKQSLEKNRRYQEVCKILAKCFKNSYVQIRKCQRLMMDSGVSELIGVNMILDGLCELGRVLQGVCEGSRARFKGSETVIMGKFEGVKESRGRVKRLIVQTSRIDSNKFAAWVKEIKEEIWLKTNNDIKEFLDAFLTASKGYGITKANIKNEDRGRSKSIGSSNTNRDIAESPLKATCSSIRNSSLSTKKPRNASSSSSHFSHSHTQVKNL